MDESLKYKKNCEMFEIFIGTKNFFLLLLFFFLEFFLIALENIRKNLGKKMQTQPRNAAKFSQIFKTNSEDVEVVEDILKLPSSISLFFTEEQHFKNFQKLIDNPYLPKYLILILKLLACIRRLS